MTEILQEEIKPRVLIIDDTPESLDVLRKTLGQNNYEIAVAPVGELALEIAPKFQPDLILKETFFSFRGLLQYFQPT